MNCEQGDIAYLKVSDNENEGAIVRCVRFVGSRLLRRPGRKETHPACWEIDPPLMSFEGVPAKVCPDSWLRPIRDQPGEDETFKWAGHPLPFYLSPKKQVEEVR